MISIGRKTGAVNIRNSFLESVLLGLALVLLGWWLVPTVSLLSICGAGFYHLLLGPIVAAILGTLGGLLWKGITRVRKGCL